MTNKFTSRKFLLVIGSAITGILLMFGVADAQAEIISGAILTVIPVVTYIIIEGKIDAERIRMLLKSAEQIVDAVDDVK